MNTPHKGQVRTIIFKEGDVWYGVALEFNIVEEGDSFDVVVHNLQEAIEGYVEAVGKGSDFSPLNQEIDSEYESMWKELVANKPVKSPVQVKHFGVTRV